MPFFTPNNNLSISTISKWKNNTSCMNEEHIVQAAKYFKISVNQLYYTELELKELNVSGDLSYDPIMAQQQVKINLLSFSFKNPGDLILLPTMVMVAIALIFSLFLKDIDFLWLLVLLAFPFFAKVCFNKDFGISKTYTINYLDDLYYKIENVNNQYFKISILLRASSIIIVLLYALLLLGKKSISQTQSLIYLLLLFISVATLVIMLLCLIFGSYKKLKEEVYVNEMDGYYSSVTNYFIGLTFACSILSTFSYDIASNWYDLFFLVVPIICYIDLKLVSKKHLEYKLMYFDYQNNTIRELFKDMEEK